MGFSIIVPTFCEAENIPELVHRIAAVDFKSQPFEVLLMDDKSPDNTASIVSHLQTEFPWLKLITREQDPGLSQAVIHGLTEARYPRCIIMDADLSHPPEKIPELLTVLAIPETDMAIGSRYISGGQTDHNWPWHRQLASTLSAKLAQWLLFPIKVKDPLSGFIAITQTKCFSGAPLCPIGWKIGLEIMIKSNCKNIREVPIHFADRKAGQSKLSMKVIFNYFRHITRLVGYKYKK